jgi:MFS family permease
MSPVASAPLRRNRDFMLLWGGQALSGLGSQISLVAFPLLVLATTGSPAKAGVVGFARLVPVVLLSLPAGVIADRVNRKRLMVCTDAIRALALASIPIALALGSAPYGLIVAVALVDGAGFIFSYVAERGALRQLVPLDQLPEAVARNESRLFGAMLAGPPIGGLLFGLARAVPFAADAVSYAASVTSMLLIGADFQEPRDDTVSPGVVEGLRWLWRERFIRSCSLLFAFSNPIYSGLSLLIVVLAKSDGASSGLIGAMLAVAAAGGLLGALAAPRLQRRITVRAALIGESCLLTAALPLMLVTHEAIVLGVLVGAAEMLTPVTNSFVVSYRVALAPNRLQGRVQAASTLISFSAGWLGPLAVGLLLQHAGANATVLVLAGWAAVLACAVLTAPVYRHPPQAEGLSPRAG